jgi:hypothetical protein
VKNIERSFSRNIPEIILHLHPTRYRRQDMSQMATNGKTSSFGLVMVVMLMAMSGACTTTHPGKVSQKPEKNHAAVSEENIFSASQEITPVSSIEKDRLSISYSLERAHGRHEELLKLTLIFRNFDNRGRKVRPHILLKDADGKVVRAYTLKEFASRLPKSARNQLDDMNWIKSSYRIPPQGIAMGQLVYHGKKFSYPLRLTIRVNKDNFEFTAK